MPKISIKAEDFPVEKLTKYHILSLLNKINTKHLKNIMKFL